MPVDHSHLQVSDFPKWAHASDFLITRFNRCCFGNSDKMLTSLLVFILSNSLHYILDRSFASFCIIKKNIKANIVTSSRKCCMCIATDIPDSCHWQQVRATTLVFCTVSTDIQAAAHKKRMPAVQIETGQMMIRSSSITLSTRKIK